LRTAHTGKRCVTSPRVSKLERDEGDADLTL
jgi:hypothetical protein